MSIVLTPSNPLFENRDGTIRLAGSRVPLDTVVYEFNRDFKRDAFDLNLVAGVRASLR